MNTFYSLPVIGGGQGLRAVSPLIATAILLVITVAGGIIIYNYVVNSLSTAQEYASLSIVSAKAVIVNNTCILNVKIANIGTAPASVDKIEIIPDNIVVKTNLLIEPGTTKSLNIFLNQTIDPSIKHYIIVSYNEGETEPYLIRLLE
jgi:FlaG/FlaF family flagellin (archaellin)